MELLNDFNEGLANLTTLKFLLYVTTLWPALLLLGHSKVITWMIGIVNGWIFIAYGFFDGNLWYSVAGACVGIFCSYKFSKEKGK